MIFEEGLVAFVLSQTSITDLISTRFYPKKLPQNPIYPATVYFVVTNRIPMAHDGPADLHHPRVQLDHYGSTYLEAKRVSNAFRRALNGYQGLMGDVDVNGVFFINETDDFGGGADAFRITADYRFNQKEN